MHYPNQINEYEGAVRKVSEAIEMARRGAYRDGYLRMILEALATLGTMSQMVGLHHRDGRMIESLKAEFMAEIERQPQHAAESPLSALVAGSEDEPQSEPQFKRNPLARA